jgi:hypothetical protein
MLSLPFHFLLREQRVLDPDWLAAYRGYPMSDQVRGRQLDDAVAKPIPPGPYEPFSTLSALLRQLDSD